MLDRQDAAGEAVGGVAEVNRDFLLKDDRPRVQILVHEMNSGAADAGAVVERLLLRVQAGVSRQQRWVNVEDAVRKSVNENRTQQPHEAREAHQRHAALPEFRDQRAIVVLASAVVLVIQDQRFNAGGDRVIETRGIGAIGNDDRDRRVEPLFGNRIDDGFQIRTTSRDQDAEFPVHSTSEILPAERSDNATNVNVPFVHPPVGRVGAPITNKFS